MKAILQGVGTVAGFAYVFLNNLTVDATTKHLPDSVIHSDAHNAMVVGMVAAGCGFVSLFFSEKKTVGAVAKLIP